MTNKEKIYFIIAERKIVTIEDIISITKLSKMKVLKAVYALILEKKIRSRKTESGFRYFVIIFKKL
jgi:hypothetical protein